MANLSKFHVVFSSSTLIRLDKDAFEGHLCQTVNNFVKLNKSNLLSPLRKRRPPQHIKHIRNTRVSRIPTFDEPCSSTIVNVLFRLDFLSVLHCFLSSLYFHLQFNSCLPDSIPTLAQCWFNVVHYNGPWMAYNVGPV